MQAFVIQAGEQVVASAFNRNDADQTLGFPPRTVAQIVKTFFDMK
jgi:hypothetical protein